MHLSTILLSAVIGHPCLDLDHGANGNCMRFRYKAKNVEDLDVG
jgi:hypothetical protein